MVASIDMILTCDVKDCGNDCLVSSDTDTVPAVGVLVYMRERAAEPPRSWRVIDGADVCYKHAGIPTEWEQWAR
jgi:hypothetical protein